MDEDDPIKANSVLIDSATDVMVGKIDNSEKAVSAGKLRTTSGSSGIR